MSGEPTASYGIVGSGWRADFFLRLAKLMPERFRVTGVVTRTAERGQVVTDTWGVPTFRSSGEMISVEPPDFVIVSVPWAVTPGVVRYLAARGIRVLAETPPAPDEQGLESLWAEVGASGLVQVAEQYPLMPWHAARLAVVERGVIGDPTSVQISSTHLYHAVALIRRYLGIGFDTARVDGRGFRAPLADPLSPRGWSGDATPQALLTTIATVDFDGRMGLYDFTDGQWWNPLRRERLVVRGTNGEIIDDSIVRLTDPVTPVTSVLGTRYLGMGLNLEGMELDHMSLDGEIVYRNPYQGARLADDDIAVAAMLDAMGAWVRGESSAPYPLAEACQDHLIALAIEESVRTGQQIVVNTASWAR
jgi:hypothetical protein